MSAVFSGMRMRKGITGQSCDAKTDIAVGRGAGSQQPFKKCQAESVYESVPAEVKGESSWKVTGAGLTGEEHRQTIEDFMLKVHQSDRQHRHRTENSPKAQQMPGMRLYLRDENRGHPGRRFRRGPSTRGDR